MKKLIAALALFGAAGSANAAEIIFFPGGGGVAPGFELVSDFNSASAQAIVTGSNFAFYDATVPGMGALPAAGDGSTYLAVMAGGLANIAFETAVRAFSFDIGSVDAFNSIIINYADAGTETVTGIDFTTNPDGNQSQDRTNGRFTINGDGRLIAGLTVASGGNSFEVDNLGISANVAAVPEPSTWAMLLVGFGFVGFAARRRRPVRTAPAI